MTEAMNNARNELFSHRLAVVVPTKDRCPQVRRLLSSLAAQTRLPDEVLIVGEGAGNAGLVCEHSQLRARFLNLPGLSISQARNAGMAAAREDAALIAFVDDDVEFEAQAIERMLTFWEQAPADLAGAGFNFRNVPSRDTARKWALRPVRRAYRLFLGPDVRKGTVLRSGFPTPIYPVSETLYVEWLETVAAVFRRPVIAQIKFDEFFAGYSYLEFLDFTYRISRKFKLCVVHDALVIHYASPIRNGYLLGKKQVLNRIYFVRKHPELSLLRCLWALVMHAGFNLVVGLMLRDAGYFKRAKGNLAGLIQAARGRLEPVGGGIR